jgi:hypothetical protein
MWVVWKINHTKQNLCSVYFKTSLQFSKLVSWGRSQRFKEQDNMSFYCGQNDVPLCYFTQYDVL